MLQSLQNLSKRFDLILACLAIFLRGTTWTPGYTGINGIANFTHRLFTRNWEGIMMFNVTGTFTFIVSIGY